MQCLQVNDNYNRYILLLPPAVYYGFGKCSSTGFDWWHYDVTEWIIDCDHVVWL